MDRIINTNSACAIDNSTEEFFFLTFFFARFIDFFFKDVDSKDQKNFVVVDFGGTFLQVAVMNVEDSVYEIIYSKNMKVRL